jgi:predicted Zn-dependent protease
MAGDYAAEELGYGLDVLAARGDIDPDSPQADAWVQAYLTDVTMHEVGHTLGLRHNFRASRMNSERDLDNP